MKSEAAQTCGWCVGCVETDACTVQYLRVSSSHSNPHVGMLDVSVRATSCVTIMISLTTPVSLLLLFVLFGDCHERTHMRRPFGAWLLVV